ncbi:MAG TPA: DNA polymerase I [Clostridia bacterium]|nr:DNA polymerase I [Clostridia bacterium]
MILDGNSLIHRAFYALPILTNSKGTFTNAAYGFTNMLLKIIKEHAPDHIVVAFDSGKTFRHEKYEEYKGTRKATPPELKSQFPLVHKILKALNIATIQLEGYEADDLIGTIAKQAEKENYQTFIVTGDRDAFQLVSSAITTVITRKGISQLEIYSPEVIKEKFGIEPAQFQDVKGLMGDVSDNIPGVPGIGEKTALKLIKEYGNIDNLFSNLEDLTPKLKEKLVSYKEQVFLSKKLGTIHCAVPVKIEFNDYKYQEPDHEKLLAIFKDLEFNSLVQNVIQSMESELKEQQALLNWELANTYDEAMAMLEKLPKEFACYVGFDQKDYLRANITIISISWGEKTLVIKTDTMQNDELSLILKQIFVDPTQKIIVWDLKSILVAAKVRGVDVESTFDDIMLLAYLLNPSASNYELGKLSLEYLNRPLLLQEDTTEQASQMAVVLWDLRTVLKEKIREDNMEELYEELELPLEYVLSDMELQGVKLDKHILSLMGENLAQNIAGLTKEIYEIAQEEFNINSPKQLGVILFEKLGLPPIKKTKTGYSTSAEVLEELAERHEIVAKILEYRQLVKLKSTYIDGLMALISPATGKVHTTFNQTITATGRLSSTEPNLQNIPIRLEIGRRIRKAFIPSSPEQVLVAADYSQIELRVLAHIAKDSNLIDAFLNNHDIHTRTASEVFGVPMSEVTKEMRRQAKAVNFGIVYGISDFGLSRDLGIPVSKAKKYIELYFSRYPGVQRFIDATIFKAREQGYVTTLLNRRRYLPDIYSTNRNVRGFGERAAINTPIQGSAADIIKLAMLLVVGKIQEAGLKTKMILQVHDELIFEVPKEELAEATVIIRNAMEQAYQLDVPLRVDMKVGANWYDMEEVRMGKNA